MLDRLEPRPGARRRRKRVARGPGGAGHKTAGRGTKGQGKRSAGRETPAWFEGGQMPLSRRLPKRGFHNAFGTRFRIVNLETLARLGEGATVDPESLRKAGILGSSRGGPVKILGQGEAPRNLVVRVHKISAAARRKVEEAGGRVELLS